LGGAVSGLFLAALCRAADTDGVLPAEQFLRQVRQPWQREAWGRFTGDVVHVRDGTKTKASIRLAMVFSPDAVRAQVVLNAANTYWVEQSHAAGSDGKVTLRLPEKESRPRLFDLGIEPEDLTLAFIYWNFVEELPRAVFLNQPCRVMALAHPEQKGHVRVWFTEKEGFPLKVQWYRRGEEQPWRSLEFKGAQKHEDDFWFVKEMRLDGAGWKTLVRFNDAEVHNTDTEPPPADLFEVRPPAAKANEVKTGTAATPDAGKPAPK